MRNQILRVAGPSTQGVMTQLSACTNEERNCPAGPSAQSCGAGHTRLNTTGSLCSSPDQACTCSATAAAANGVCQMHGEQLMSCNAACAPLVHSPCVITPVLALYVCARVMLGMFMLHVHEEA